MDWLFWEKENYIYRCKLSLSFLLEPATDFNQGWNNKKVEKMSKAGLYGIYKGKIIKKCNMYILWAMGVEKWSY